MLGSVTQEIPLGPKMDLYIVYSLAWQFCFSLICG